MIDSPILSTSDICIQLINVTIIPLAIVLLLHRRNEKLSMRTKRYRNKRKCWVINSLHLHNPFLIIQIRAAVKFSIYGFVMDTEIIRRTSKDLSNVDTFNCRTDRVARTKKRVTRNKCLLKNVEKVIEEISGNDEETLSKLSSGFHSTNQSKDPISNHLVEKRKEHRNGPLVIISKNQEHETVETQYFKILRWRSTWTSPWKRH